MSILDFATKRSPERMTLEAARKHLARSAAARMRRRFTLRRRRRRRSWRQATSCPAHASTSVNITAKAAWRPIRRSA